MQDRHYWRRTPRAIRDMASNIHITSRATSKTIHRAINSTCYVVQRRVPGMTVSALALVDHSAWDTGSTYFMWVIPYPSTMFIDAAAHGTGTLMQHNHWGKYPPAGILTGTLLLSPRHIAASSHPNYIPAPDPLHYSEPSRLCHRTVRWSLLPQSPPPVC